MKLCPQCDFIYEDDQTFCDMDGKELVNNNASFVDQNIVPESANDGAVARSRALHFATVLIVIAVLAALGFLIYMSRLRHSDNSYAAVSPTDSAKQMPARNALPQASPSDSIASTSLEASLQGEPGANAGASPSPDVSEESSAGAAKTAAHSLSVQTGNSSSPVIVRLTNGATIKADDAWETKNGIWYRQGGMVTFLKRSQVRTIERRPVAPTRAITPTKIERTEATSPVVAQNRLRLKRLETAQPKQPSRVTSFLKKTGQILSRPFKR